jgi:hypothetical protein
LLLDWIGLDVIYDRNFFISRESLMPYGLDLDSELGST